MRISINCEGLNKNQINDEIRARIRDNTDIYLNLENYGYRDLKRVVIPNSVYKFRCNNNITTLAGLLLPNSVIKFNCSENKIQYRRIFITTLITRL